MSFLERFGIRKRDHRVEVHDVRPLPGDEDDFDPYFAAICHCGWVDVVESEDAARASATKHSPKVDPDLKRPLA